MVQQFFHDYPRDEWGIPLQWSLLFVNCLSSLTGPKDRNLRFPRLFIRSHNIQRRSRGGRRRIQRRLMLLEVMVHDRRYHAAQLLRSWKVTLKTFLWCYVVHLNVSIWIPTEYAKMFRLKTGDRVFIATQSSRHASPERKRMPSTIYRE